ncbi:MAG: lamin tail domain-containing protein [Deltaproteobacteria bacterium]|nr:lamin tail domain-containing protein [Deltaproteobacteria bacterium]
MRRRVFVIGLLTLSAAAYACSESTDGVVPDGGVASGDAGSGDAPTDSTSGDKDGPSFIPDADTSDSQVLINELDPGDEWIELVNSGSAASDISGFSVADRDKDTGNPKLTEAVTFPSGTILSPRSYLLVRGGGLDGGKACPDGGQSYCFNAEFGVSRKNGETIYLLDPSKKTVGTVVYPPDGGGDGTWGRLPSGDPSGTFQPTRSTPGAANVAP